MKDRISLYPGRVILTPVAGQENVYDMVRADEPIDVGTPLNKNTFLTDEIAETMGLGKDATPNDMFAKMQFLSDVHVWHKIASDIVYSISETEENSYKITANNNISSPDDFAYSGRSFGTGYKLNAEGVIELTGVFTPSKTPCYDNLSYWDSIIPVYMKVDETLYHITEQNSGGSNFMHYTATQFIVTAHEAGEDLGFVNNTNENAYPPSEADGIAFTYIGKIGKGLSKIKTVYGSYTGDGAKSRKFEFAGRPILMIIEGSNYSTSAIRQIYINGAQYSAPLGSTSSSYIHNLTWTEKSVTASADDYFYHVNSSGKKFNYVALVEEV